MKGLYHFSKFEHLIPMRSSPAVGSLGGEQDRRIVTPIILESFSRERVEPHQFVFVELLNGHQLNRGYSKILEIGNFIRQTSKRARISHLRTRMERGTTHVSFIDDRF